MNATETCSRSECDRTGRHMHLHSTTSNATACDVMTGQSENAMGSTLYWQKLWFCVYFLVLLFLKTEIKMNKLSIFNCC